MIYSAAFVGVPEEVYSEEEVRIGTWMIKNHYIEKWSQLLPDQYIIVGKRSFRK